MSSALTFVLQALCCGFGDLDMAFSLSVCFSLSLALFSFFHFLCLALVSLCIRVVLFPGRKSRVDLISSVVMGGIKCSYILSVEQVLKSLNEKKCCVNRQKSH